MKHYRMEHIPAHEKPVLESATCDLCGSRIGAGKHYSVVDKVEIRHRTGQSYPECGRGEEATVDLCGSCFESRLVPWLEAQGAKVERESWEF